MISIIIPTYNNLESFLRPCLRSIATNTNMKDVEVLVSANGCRDGTAEYVTELGEPFKLVLSTDPIGFPKAVNAGIKESAGDYVILLNDDTILLQQSANAWIDMLLKPFLDDPDVGLTGPLKSYIPELKKEFLIFFCVMIKRELFSELGYLDESVGLGGTEDMRFCIEAQNAGYKIVQVPDEQSKVDNDRVIGGFPIWHEGEGTMSGITEWSNTLDKNMTTLIETYQSDPVVSLGSLNSDPHTAKII